MTKARELAELSRTIIDTSDATAITINADEEVTLADDLFLADGKKAIFGADSDLSIFHGSGHSYIQENGTGNLKIGGTNLHLMNGALTEYYFAANENGGAFLYYDNGLRLVTTASGVEISGTLSATGVLTVIDGSTSAPSISNAGDSNTGIYFPADDELGLLVGGSRKLHVTSSGVDIENGTVGVGVTPHATIPISAYAPDGAGNIKLTRAGTSENLLLGTYYVAATGNDLILSTTGGMTLDADSGVIDFKDGGTNIGRIENASSDFKLESRVQDKDIVLVGNDGGTGVEALRLDMSNAGAATFSGSVTAGGALTINTGNNGVPVINLLHTNAAADNFAIYAGTPGVTNGGFTIRDVDASSNRLVIDSSGKLLVGKGSSNYASEGIELRPNEVLITKNGLNPLSVRGSGNGSFISINNAGTSVGSIGSEGGDSLFVQGGAASGAGLLFHGTAGKLLPVRNGASIDNTIDLGQSSRRFKDLYLYAGTLKGLPSATSRLVIDSANTAGYLGVAGTEYFAWNTTDIRPTADNAYNLGVNGASFKDLYLSGTAKAKSFERIWHLIDLSSLDFYTFYPVSLEGASSGTSNTFELFKYYGNYNPVVNGTTMLGSVSMKMDIIGNTWGGNPIMNLVHNVNQQYRSMLGAIGLRGYYRAIIWLRGGYQYHYTSNTGINPTVYSSVQTFYNSPYNYNVGPISENTMIGNSDYLGTTTVLGIVSKSNLQHWS